MAEEVKLKAKKRDKDKSNNRIRTEGKIPAILYGHGVKNIPLEVDYEEFSKVFESAGEASLVSIALERGDNRKVLIREVQKEPVLGRFLHADFYQVKMTEKLTALVPFTFKGVSKAVKENGGILIKNLNEIEIEALPQDLPREIIVDISSLENINDRILLKDLQISDKVKTLAGKNEVVAIVTPPRTEEELKALEEKPEEEVSEVEVVKKEEEEEAEEEGTEKEASSVEDKKEEKKEKKKKKEKQKI